MSHHAIVNGPVSLLAKDPELAEQRRQELQQMLDNAHSRSRYAPCAIAAVVWLRGLRRLARVARYRRITYNRLERNFRRSRKFNELRLFRLIHWVRAPPRYYVAAAPILMWSWFLTVFGSYMSEWIEFGILSRQLVNLDAGHDEVCPLSALYRAALRQIYLTRGTSSSSWSRPWRPSDPVQNTGTYWAPNRFLCAWMLGDHIDERDRECSLPELPLELSTVALPGFMALSKESWPRELAGPIAWYQVLLASQQLYSGELQLPGLSQKDLAEFIAKAPIPRQLHMATLMRRLPRSRRYAFRQEGEDMRQLLVVYRNL